MISASHLSVSCNTVQCNWIAVIAATRRDRWILVQYEAGQLFIGGVRKPNFCDWSCLILWALCAVWDRTSLLSSGDYCGRAIAAQSRRQLVRITVFIYQAFVVCSNTSNLSHPIIKASICLVSEKLYQFTSLNDVLSVWQSDSIKCKLVSSHRIIYMYPYIIHTIPWYTT